MYLRRFVCAFLVVLFGTASSFSQVPVSDPQAVSFAAQSIAALTGGTAINDVTLTGTVTWSGGTDPEMGSATLLASGTTESRTNFVLPSGTRTEIRDASAGTAQGEWIAQTGTSGIFASQNCATDAVWFFPVLGSLAAGPGVVLSYVGQETRNGQIVQHIQSYIYQPNPPPVTPSLQQLSAIDFYLDSGTHLPVAIVFNTHPDNTASTNLSVEVDFSNYQVLNGILVPTHIQRFSQGSLLADIAISSAAFNTGIPISNFTIN